MKATILNHEEFGLYEERVADVIDAWCQAHKPILMELKQGVNPKSIIRTLGEDLLGRFADLPLLDRYDVYQRLMDYWDEEMQDDLYLIAANGWIEAARPRGIIEDKERKIKETPDLTLTRKKYKMDLIPPGLIVAYYFTFEQTAVEELQAKQEAAARELEEFVEEPGTGEGALNGLEGKGGITKGNVQQRAIELKEAILKAYPEGPQEHKQVKSIKKSTFGVHNWTKNIKDEEGLFKELDILYAYLRLMDHEKTQKDAYRQALDTLHTSVIEKYAHLTEAEIKRLVVKEKWFVRIRSAIESEVQRLTQQLAGRVKELEERYARPLPELENEVEALGAKVEGHLKRMGISW